MNAIALLFSQPWVEDLGRTLLHFLWQGALIAAAYAAARRMARDSSANVRYLLGCAALIAMLAAPFVTWFVRSSSVPAASVQRRVYPKAEWPVTLDGFLVPVASSQSQSSVWAERFLPSVVAIWMAGTLVFWIRLAGAWVVTAQMRSMLVRRAPPEWQSRFTELGACIGISRPVRLLVSAIVQVPTVVGCLRPVVLIPVGALAGLPAEHVEALLIHELAHIRRHDYLVNLLQSIAEALLFYHPAVWWLSKNIRAERELCCDDIAVAASGDVLTYARALVDLEGFRPVHVAAALAANGGSLAQRIGRLLGQARPATDAFSGAGVISIAILLVASAWGIFAQTQAQPKFEVASVKPAPANGPTTRGLRPLSNGRFTATNAHLMMLIMNAYGVQPYQIIGDPSWSKSDGFSIEAKGDPNADRTQVLLMLRSLLEDRFQLRFHRETKDLPEYVLTVTKGGAKLPQSKEGECVNADPNQPMMPGAALPCGMPRIGFSGTLTGRKLSMAQLVQTLAMTLNRPVTDHTGITQTFDVDLKFAPDEATAGLPRPMGPAADASDPSGPPSILIAIQEQLGLKLESTKGPVEVMVIDHVEKPSEN